jgi:hypothetical protein
MNNPIILGDICQYLKPTTIAAICGDLQMALEMEASTDRKDRRTWEVLRNSLAYAKDCLAALEGPEIAAEDIAAYLDEQG